MRARRLVDGVLRTLEGIEHGRLRVVTPDGKEYGFAGRSHGPHADIELHDWNVVARAARGGDIAFATDYRNGRWQSSDPAALIEFILRNEQHFNGLMYGNRLYQWVARGLQTLRMNTRRGSQRNILEHYDLGNEFYATWLDPSMTYSSALFRSPEDSLSDGQRQKHNRILELLPDRSQSLLEVGCGWGSFVEHAMQRKDQAITAITISRAQHAYASRRLAANQPRASIRLEDYRDVEGHFDSIVSIEMFEAVGERYWGTFFRKLKSLLATGGTAVVQTILIGDERFEDYRRRGDTIRRFIFPGGMLPSPSRFEDAARQAGLRVAGRHYFGADYARTLRTWQRRFDSNVDRIRALGFDESFMRLWRYYLAFCTAGFAAGRTDVAQYELCHA